MLLSVRNDDDLIYVVHNDNGEVEYEKIPSFKPSFFIEDKTTDGHDEKDYRCIISKTPMKYIQTENLKDYKYRLNDLKKTGIKTYNGLEPAYQYIIDYYRTSHKTIEDKLHGDVKIDKPDLWSFDIETNKHNGKFARPEEALAPITLIQFKSNKTKKKYIFGWMEKNYKSEDENTTYIYSESEEEMIKKFVLFYREHNMILLFAWFGGTFDFPYLSNRMNNLGIKVSLLSKFGKTKTMRFISKKENFEYEAPIEANWLDYVDVYKKITFNAGKESWALDFIANYHGVDGKLDFKEHGFEDVIDLINGDYNPDLDKHKGSLYKAWINRDEDPQTFREETYHVFVKYGELDVDVLDSLEDKIKSFNTLFMLSKMMCVNIEDTLKTIKPWHVFSVSLAEIEKMVLQDKTYNEHKWYAGGFVFSKPQLTKWVALFDFNSLYPNNMVTYNLCPTTYVPLDKVDEELLSLTEELRNTKVDDKKINAMLFQTESADDEAKNDVDETFELQEDIFMKMSKDKKKKISLLLKKHNLVMSPSGHFFTRAFKGFYPRVLNSIYTKRKAIQKIQHEKEIEYQTNPSPELKEEIDDLLLSSTVLKILMNSLYGALSSKSFPLANVEVGSAITSFGRMLIKFVSSKTSEYFKHKYDWTKLKEVAQ